MPDLVTIGETMVLILLDSEDVPSELKLNGKLSFGGAESNVAVGLSRLGHKTRWISALGCDSLGQFIADAIAREGVEVAVTFQTERNSGLMIKSLSATQERKVSYYRSGSAASYLSSEDIADNHLEDSQIIHLTGILPALSNVTRTATLDLAKRAKLLGKFLSFDVNFRPALWDESRAKFVMQEIASNADIVFGDRYELGLLVEDPNLSTHELLAKVQSLCPKQVILKLAEAGALGLIEGEFFEQSSFPVKLVDTVGAGDAFVAGYLSGLLEGLSKKDRMTRAAFCGAQVCASPGDWEGSPKRSELVPDLLEPAR